MGEKLALIFSTNDDLNFPQIEQTFLRLTVKMCSRKVISIGKSSLASLSVGFSIAVKNFSSEVLKNFNRKHAKKFSLAHRENLLKLKKSFPRRLIAVFFSKEKQRNQFEQEHVSKVV